MASRPIVTAARGATEGEGGELGEAEAWSAAGDGSQTAPSGCGAGCAGGGGDGDVGVGEDPAGLGLAAGAGEGEEDPVGVPGRFGQAGVAVELFGEAVEAFGAVVVLDEEREVGAAFGPDAVAVGADDLAPLAGAASLGPPLVERRSRAGCGRRGAVR